jgi:hypothetical protein
MLNRGHYYAIARNSYTPSEASDRIPLNVLDVEECLDAEETAFASAFATSLADLPPSSRPPNLSATTGAVAECLFSGSRGLGYASLFDLEGPGRHGIDLAMLSPALDRVVIFEVKGTLQPRRLPRLSRGELARLSTGWVDRKDNPAWRNSTWPARMCTAGWQSSSSLIAATASG